MSTKWQLVEQRWACHLLVRCPKAAAGDRSVSYLTFLDTDKKLPKKAPETHPAGPRAPSPAVGPLQPPAQGPPMPLHHHKVFLAVFFLQKIAFCLVLHSRSFMTNKTSARRLGGVWRWTVPPPAEISTSAAGGSSTTWTWTCHISQEDTTL